MQQLGRGVGKQPERQVHIVVIPTAHACMLDATWRTRCLHSCGEGINLYATAMSHDGTAGPDTKSHTTLRSEQAGVI